MKNILQGIAVILFALVLMLFGMALGKDVFLILALFVGCVGMLRTFWKELKDAWQILKE